MEIFYNEYYVYTQYLPTDIYPIQYGEQQCHGEHYFGPGIRRNYLLHYIYGGKGIYRIGDREYKPIKGQMFLIRPNRLVHYKADRDDPWLYRWIEFNGSMADKILDLAGLSDELIYDDNDDYSTGQALLDIVQSGNMRFEDLMKKFWGFISALTNGAEDKSPSPAQEYVNMAENYIKTKINAKVTVNDVAKYVGINRSYLTRLFQEQKNISPQQYIIELKMTTAAQYMKNAGVSITEAAQSVGYFDNHVFNKTFKNHFHQSPTEWRQRHISKHI